MPVHATNSESSRKSLTECVHNITWAWFTVVMGTGVVSALADAFPFGSGSFVLELLTLSFFLLNFVIFMILSALMIFRYFLFPGFWSNILQNPAGGLFIGCFPMGTATLINSASICHQKYGFSDISFVYVLWILWWVDVILSITIALGMFYVMMMIQGPVLPRMALIWLLPISPLIVVSSAGGLLAESFKKSNPTHAIITSTTTVSLGLVFIGLSFSFMIIATYLTRLVLHGPPDPMLVLSIFISLGPICQGGCSLLINGQSISDLLPVPVHTANSGASAALGQIAQTLCVCWAFFLWCMGIAWFMVSISVTFGVLRSHKISFTIMSWGLVFPHGVFALLSLQLGEVLDNSFFRFFGAVASVLILVLWLFLFIRTISAIIDTSIFDAPSHVSSMGPVSDDSDKEIIRSTTSTAIDGFPV